MKQYRIYLDIKANDLDEALKIADEKAQDGIREDSTITKVFNVVDYPFNREEELVILETVRIALGDANVFDDIAEKMDMKDKAMKNLQSKVTEYMA
jgi:hypothetical protein